MKKLLLLMGLALCQAVNAAVLYSVSVQSPPTNPDATWWGSFSLTYDPGYLSSAVAIAEADFGAGHSCVIIFPTGDCDSVSFDPQGSGLDKVTMHTTLGSFDFLFADQDRRHGHRRSPLEAPQE